MIVSALLALHLLGAVLWVGGMAFALLVLRPSLAVLQPAQRLALHGEVFRRFFRIVWHAMPLLLVSGYAMLFGVFGGFAGVNWAVHLMHLLGLVMAEWLFELFPKEPEGALSKRLNALVTGAICADVARSIGVVAFLPMFRPSVPR